MDSASGEVPPGTYDLEVRTTVPFDTQVTVAAGEVVLVTIDTAVGTIMTVDEAGNPIDGIAVIIKDATTGFQLFGNRAGSWDVPPGTYDLEVRTLLPFDLQVTVAADEVVTVTVDTIVGTIMTTDLAGNPIDGITVVIKQADDGRQLFGNANGEWEVPPGTYDLEVRTIIPFDTQVTVGPGETVTVPIDTAMGTIMTTDLAGNPIDGITVVIKQAGDGRQLFGNANGEWEVPPGTYDLEVRTIIPFDTQVTVAAGETVTVPIDTATGTIISVDEAGNSITGTTFVIKQAGEGRQLFGNANGEWEVPPGDYVIEVRAEERYEVTVTVAAGEVVPVTVR